MKKTLKIITVFIFSFLIFILFPKNTQALSQGEAGQTLADFAINFANQHGDETAYSWDDYYRGNAYKGIKTSGTSSQRKIFIPR